MITSIFFFALNFCWKLILIIFFCGEFFFLSELSLRDIYAYTLRKKIKNRKDVITRNAYIIDEGVQRFFFIQE